MSEKFTKGPWLSVDGDRFSKEVIITTDERTESEIVPICEMDIYYDGIIGKEQQANAYLIAAAPDMYKEIKQDIEWLERMKSIFVIGSTEFTSCCLRIKTKKELLAKARGEA